MKKRFLSAFLAFILLAGLAVQTKADAASALSAQQVYQSMIALKEQYPEGTPWTNDNFYAWHGGIYSGGYGCAGFAFMLSDAAFGTLPARRLTEFTFSDIQAGDILRINSDTHSVIVLEVLDNSVVIAEGNFNSSVHWGRTLSLSQIQSATYMITRYPDSNHPSEPDPTPTPEPTPTPTPEPTPIPTPEPTPTPTPEPTPTPTPEPTPTPTPQPIPTPTPQPIPTPIPQPIPTPTPLPTPASVFTDVPANEFYANAVSWAVAGNITKGATETTFEPETTCSEAQILTFLWRAAGEPEIADKQLPFEVDEAYRGAVLWADDTGMIDRGTFAPSTPCTRSTAVRFIWQAFLSPSVETASSFTDVPTNTNYAAAVFWAVENGVTNGTDEEAGLFSPDDTCTRGQIVTFLHRAYVEEVRLTTK